MLSVKVIQRRRLAKRFLRVPYVPSNDAQVTFETNFCARNPPPRKRWPSCNRAAMPGAYRTPRCEMCATFKCEILYDPSNFKLLFFLPRQRRPTFRCCQRTAVVQTSLDSLQEDLGTHGWQQDGKYAAQGIPITGFTNAPCYKQTVLDSRLLLSRHTWIDLDLRRRY